MYPLTVFICVVITLISAGGSKLLLLYLMMVIPVSDVQILCDWPQVLKSLYDIVHPTGVV